MQFQLKCQLRTFSGALASLRPASFPAPPRPRSRRGELLTADITAGTATKYRRALDDFDIFIVVTRAALSLHMESSSLSRLPRYTWNGALCLTNFPLVLQEPWSLLCVDLFCLQLPSARQFLIPLFTSVLCGD